MGLKAADSGYGHPGKGEKVIAITHQAIDEASNRILGLWHEGRQQKPDQEPEGLRTWLFRIAHEAIERGDRLPSGKVRYAGMKMLIEPFTHDGVLKSVERVKND